MNSVESVQPQLRPTPLGSTEFIICGQLPNAFRDSAFKASKVSGKVALAKAALLKHHLALPLPFWSTLAGKIEALRAQGRAQRAAEKQR